MQYQPLSSATMIAVARFKTYIFLFSYAVCEGLGRHQQFSTRVLAVNVSVVPMSICLFNVHVEAVYYILCFDDIHHSTGSVDAPCTTFQRLSHE